MTIYSIFYKIRYAWQVVVFQAYRSYLVAMEKFWWWRLKKACEDHNKNGQKLSDDVVEDLIEELKKLDHDKP
jgi:hypothetical protein